MNVTPIPAVSVIRQDGSVDPRMDPGLALDRLRALYADMLRARVVDERVAALSEEGRVGFLPRGLGREAAVIGTTAALRDGDWIFPTHGDWAAALHRKMPLETFLHRLHGDDQDPLRGHDMPGGLSARRLAIASVSAPAATQLPHAVGVAYAARLKGRDLVTAALFDANEIDAADFHSGLNFAGVMKAATVFVCRVRARDLEDGTVPRGASEYAVAYGIQAARCDGSDLLAVVGTVREAVQRASIGAGPTVIDLVLGEDDDAMSRARAHLETLGAWSEAEERGVRAKIDAELTDALARCGNPPPPESVFEHVFRDPPEHLRAQRDALTSGPRPPR